MTESHDDEERTECRTRTPTAELAECTCPSSATDHGASSRRVSAELAELARARSFCERATATRRNASTSDSAETWEFLRVRTECGGDPASDSSAGGRSSRPGRRTAKDGSPQARRGDAAACRRNSADDAACLDHEGRRHRARDRGGDRLRRARARHRPPPGAALGAVQRLAHADPRGAPPARGARARLLRPEPRRPRAHDLARRAARGVHGARRARGARDRGGRGEDDARGPRRARGGRAALRRGSRRTSARASPARRAARSWASGCARTTPSTTSSTASPTCRSSSSSRRARAARSPGPAVWAPGDHSIDGLYAKNAEQHRAIRQALAAGSGEGARALAREHVLSSFHLLEAILEQVGGTWPQPKRSAAKLSLIVAA